MTENKLSKKDNKKILIILFVFIIAAVLSAGYIFKDKIFTHEDSLFSEQEKNDQQKVDGVFTAVPVTIQCAGKIEPIDGVKIDDLQVVSLGNVSDVNEDGKFTATLYQDKVTSVAAMLPDQNFGLINIILSDKNNKNNNLELTAETTAASLIFMTPFLLTSNPDEASKILEVIENDESVKKFAVVINEKIGTTENIMQDDEYKTAFKEALESVLLKLSQ